MTLTPNFNPKESAPEIYIYDYDGVLQYQYQTLTTQSSPTQNFRLTDLSVTNEMNGSYGHATLMIEDNQGLLIDSSKRKKVKIQREWDIQIYFGKDNAGLQRWFYGKIKSASVLRPGTAVQRIVVNCVGWGQILKARITQMKRNQAKQSNGIDLDTSDDSTKIYNLLLDVFEDTDHQVDENIPQINSIGAVVTEDGINQNVTDVSIANINELNNTYAGYISRLVGAINADWLIDYDKRFIVRDANFYDSGFLLTNNLSGTTAQNWDSTKLMYIKNEPFSWEDSSFETMYSWIHGFGHFTPALNQKEETTPDATDNMDDEFLSIPFTPTVDNIFKVAVRLTKTGTPASDGYMEIRGDDGTGKPSLTDIRRKVRIKQSILQGLGTTTPAGWYEIPITPKLEFEAGTPLHLVFLKYGDASNTFNLDYKSGSGTYYVSTDDSTWSIATGKVNFRMYDAKRLMTTVENTVLSQRFPNQREKLFPIRADLEAQTVRQTMIVASEALGRERRVYENVVATMPDKRIPLASFIRFEDVTTGLDIKAQIISYTVEMHAGDNMSNIGASTITLTLDDIHAI